MTKVLLMLLLPFLFCFGGASATADGWLVSVLYESPDCTGPVLEESGKPAFLGTCQSSQQCQPVLGGAYAASARVPAIGQRLVCVASAPQSPRLSHRFYKWDEAFAAYPRGCLTLGSTASYRVDCQVDRVDQVFYSDSRCGVEDHRDVVVPAGQLATWQTYCSSSWKVSPSMHFIPLAVIGIVLTLMM